MAYKITGSILIIEPTQSLVSTKTGNSYTKRDLIIAVRTFDPHTGQPEVNRDNTPKLTFMGDRCRDLDQFKVGDIVVVDFDINGRSYDKDGKTEYFTEVRPFRIALNKQQAQPVAPYQQPQQYQQPVAQQATQGYQQPYPQPYGQQPQQAIPQQPQSANQDLPF